MPQFNEFTPPHRMLMGPGPSDVHERVLQALARPTIGHLDPQFIRLMDEVKALQQYVMQTQNPQTFTVSAPGSAGMETCFVNLIEPGDKVIVCINGVFGMRMLENVKRVGAQAVVVEDEWGTAVDPEKVAAALKANPDAKALAFVHSETSTGVLSDAQTLAKLAQQQGCLTIVDAVTSLAGVPLKCDDWGLDAVYSGTQKCMSAPPGLSPVTFSAKAEQALKNRKTPVQSWFLDVNLLSGYWSGGKRAYHHTAPVNALYGWHESLRMVQEEGLENSWARHAFHHQAFKAGLEALGLELMVEENSRLPQLNLVRIPEGVDDGAFREVLLNKNNLEIGAGLGKFAGQAWRIGLMGVSCDQQHVISCLSFMEQALKAQGYGCDANAGSDAASAWYREQ